MAHPLALSHLICLGLTGAPILCGWGCIRFWNPQRKDPCVSPLCTEPGTEPGTGCGEWAFQVIRNRGPLKFLHIQLIIRIRGAVEEAGISRAPRKSCWFCIKCWAKNRFSCYSRAPGVHRLVPSHGFPLASAPVSMLVLLDHQPQLGTRGCP